MNIKSQRQLKVNRHLVLGFYYFEKWVFRKSNQSKFSAIKIFLYIGPNNLLMHHFSSDLHWKWENTIFKQRLKISKFWQSGLVKNQPSNFFFFFSQFWDQLNSFILSSLHIMLEHLGLRYPCSEWAWLWKCPPFCSHTSPLLSVWIFV